MRKLSKKIYNDNIGDRHAVKALALFVFVKENKPTSVFTDYTITALAKFANLSRNTTRKRIKKLEEMGLVERVGKNGQHLLFKRARAKYANVFNFIEAPNNDGSCDLNKATFSNEMVRKLLLMYARDDSVVYDSFMGTGTTAVGAIKENMRYIGSELSSAQCEYARRRIEIEESQLTLF